MTNKENKWHRLGCLFLIIAVCFGILLPQSVTAETKEPEFVSSSYLPSLSNNHCSGTHSRDMPIGLQLYGPTGYKEPSFKLLQQTGIAWMRQSVAWSAIQPEQPTEGSLPQYFWGSADSHLRAALDNCVNIIATLDTNPDWAATSGDRSPIKPEFLDEYADFVGAVVERYDGDGNADAAGSPVVTYWEMYNEPDFGSSINEGWGEYGDEYADMLEAIYPVVKAANPYAQVVFGGIAYNGFYQDGGLFVKSFVEDVLDAGGGQFFDVMNIHHYPVPGPGRNQWTESNSSGLPEKIRLIREELKAHNLTKPLVITEVGWHSSGPDSFPPSSHDIQGRYMVSLITQAIAYDVFSVIWWSFADIDDYPAPSGIIIDGSHPTPKPSYTVFVELVRRVGHSDFIKVTSEATATTDLEAYQFLAHDSGDTFYVAWRNPTAMLDPNIPFDDSITLPLKVPGTKATIYTKEGILAQALLDADDGQSDGHITVQVGGSPIYVVMD